MNSPFPRQTLPALGLAALLAGAATASAIPTQVNNTDLLGYVNPGSPANPTDEMARLNNLITAYNADPTDRSWSVGVAPDVRLYTLDAGIDVPAPTLPLAASYGGQLGGGGITQLIDLGGNQYDWLLAKWADVAAYYYIGGLAGQIEVVNDVVRNHNGVPQALSHYTLYTGRDITVPDGGATLALFGLGLTGLALLRRKTRS